MKKNTVQRAKSVVSKARTIRGVVASTKNKDTVIVEVIRMTRHPMYRKAVRRTKRFAAHVVNMDLSVGDDVIMKEIPPMSKTKHFLIISRADRKVFV
ncbi:MAG: 30S ribosomal protein S17 [Patescibacteria group bacterium]